MRYLLFLLSAVLLVSCSTNYEHEDQICNCLDEYAQEEGKDIDNLIQKTEDYLVAQSILKDNSGESYHVLASIMSEGDEFEIVEWKGLEDDVQDLIRLKGNPSCNMMRFEDHNSKVNEITERTMEAATSGEVADFKFWWKIYEDVLEPIDMEHKFYKLEIIGMFYLSNMTKDLLEGLNMKDLEAVDVIVEDRDVLEVMLDQDDQVAVNGEIVPTENVQGRILWFYEANLEYESDPEMPEYSTVDLELCDYKIREYGDLMKEYPNDPSNKDEREKWELRKEICLEIEEGEYREISEMAMIRLVCDSGATYQSYYDLQQIIKQVVINLRSEYCMDIWGREYSQLNKDEEKDRIIIQKLRVLVPERVVESAPNEF